MLDFLLSNPPQATTHGILAAIAVVIGVAMAVSLLICACCLVATGRDANRPAPRPTSSNRKAGRS